MLRTIHVDVPDDIVGGVGHAYRYRRRVRREQARGENEQVEWQFFRYVIPGCLSIRKAISAPAFHL